MRLTSPEGGSVVCRFKNYITSTHFPPLLPLCDISSASTEEFTPEEGSVYGFLSSQLRNLSQKEKARAVRFSGLEVFSEKMLIKTRKDCVL